jgi:allophanate hydrolase
VLDNGETVKGFLTEPHAITGATEITSFGGWRNYLAQTPLAS